MDQLINPTNCGFSLIHITSGTALDSKDRTTHHSRESRLEPDLCHHAVCTCVLLILEDDVGVVVRGQLLEALGAAGDFPFVPPAGSQRLLGHVGAELLVGERRQLPGRPPLAVASARAAALAARPQEKGAPGEERHQRRQPHSGPGRRVTPRRVAELSPLCVPPPPWVPL